jgi:sulfatase maturation enzyme AslB (radical SAM superfamily)
MTEEMLCAALSTALGLAAGRSDLVFSGGEPLLEFDLIRRAAEYAEALQSPKKRTRFRVSTNGLLLSSEIAAFLQEHDFAVQLSFDGVAPAQAYRGAHSFEYMDRLLDRLRAEHPKLFLSRLQIAMTVIPPTVRYLSGSVEYFLRKRVCEISVAPSMTHYPGWDTADLAELDRQVGAVSDLSRRHLERTGEVPVKFLRKHRGEAAGGERTHRLCSALRGSALVVDADGQAYGCPFFAESYQVFPEGSRMHGVKTLGMGAIADPGFPERRKAALQRARRLLPEDWKSRCHSSYGRCCECPFRSGCSICPVSIWSKPKDMDDFRLPDFICAFNRVVLGHRERFPCMPGLLEHPA